MFFATRRYTKAKGGPGQAKGVEDKSKGSKISALRPLRPSSTPFDYASASERITRLDGAGFKSSLEPGNALLRGAMCEGFGRDACPRAPLDPVIADACGGVQCFCRVIGVQ